MDPFISSKISKTKTISNKPLQGMALRLNDS